MAKIESHRQFKKDNYFFLTGHSNLEASASCEGKNTGQVWILPAIKAPGWGQESDGISTPFCPWEGCGARGQKQRLLLLLLNSGLFLFLNRRKCLSEAPRMHYKCTGKPESMTLNARKTSPSLILQCLSIPAEAS